MGCLGGGSDGDETGNGGGSDGDETGNGDRSGNDVATGGLLRSSCSFPHLLDTRYDPPLLYLCLQFGRHLLYRIRLCGMDSNRSRDPGSFVSWIVVDGLSSLHHIAHRARIHVELHPRHRSLLPALPFHPSSDRLLLCSSDLVPAVG